MAKMTLDIPDAVLPRVLAALSESRTQNDPLTPVQYAKQAVINFIFSKVLNFESSQAAMVAGSAAIVQTKNDIIIT